MKRINLCQAILFLLAMSACSGAGITPAFQETPQPIIEKTEQLVPTAPQSENSPLPSITIPAVTPTKVAANSASPEPPLTPTSIEIINIPQLEFKITYVKNEIDENNEIISSQLFTLISPYEIPLSIPIENDLGQENLQIIKFAWSRNQQKLILSLESVDGHQSLTLFDNSTGSLTPLLMAQGPDDQILINENFWSRNDRWVYIPVLEPFAIRGQIIDTETGEIISLNYLTQNELLSWSMATSDQYILLSRPNYPEPEGENLSLRQINEPNPLALINNFQNYLILGDRFSLSPNGDLGLLGALTQDGTPIYLLINFISGQWREVIRGQALKVTPHWSPNNKWVVLSRYGIGLFLLDLENPESLTLIPNTEYAASISWLLAQNIFIFRDGFKAFAIDPNFPENKFLIRDFSNNLQDTPSGFQINVLENP